MPATIVVRLPADATLTIDDSPTRSTSSVRTLVTPPLPPGRAYSYTLKAVAMRGGHPLTVVKRVTVSGGQQTEVELNPATEPGPPE
jgi:uncharacterized protein (TIGR03000 family)